MNTQTDYEHLRNTLNLAEPLAREWAQARMHPYECTQRMRKATDKTIEDLVRETAAWSTSSSELILTPTYREHARIMNGMIFHTDYTHDAALLDTLQTPAPIQLTTRLTPPIVRGMLKEGLADATVHNQYWKPAVRAVDGYHLHERELVSLMLDSLAGTLHLPIADPEDMFAEFHMMTISSAHKNPESFYLARMTHNNRDYCIEKLSQIIARAQSPCTSYQAGIIS